MRKSLSDDSVLLNEYNETFNNADFIFDCAHNDFSKLIQDLAQKKKIKYVLINNGVLASQNKSFYENCLNFFLKFKS